MSQNDLVQNFKILAFDLSDLPTHMLGEAVINCSNFDIFGNALSINRSSNISVACTSDKLIGLDVLLIDYSVDTIYVLNIDGDHELKEWAYGLISNKIIEVQNINQLMRHLCTKTMLYYYTQGLKYQKRGDHGLANLCFQDSLKALNYSAKFI